MELNIENYKPINSKEKIDLLLDEISKQDVNLESIRILILQHISKLKMQLYFNESLDRLKRDKKATSFYDSYKRKSSTVINENKSKKTKKRKLKAEKSSNLLRVLEGLSLDKLSLFLNLSPKYISYVLGRILNREDIDLSYTLSENDFNLCYDFFNSRYKSIIRDQKKKKMQTSEINSFSFKRILHIDKCKTTYGKEGNYSKLIYIRSKT